MLAFLAVAGALLLPVSAHASLPVMADAEAGVPIPRGTELKQGVATQRASEVVTSSADPSGAAPSLTAVTAVHVSPTVSASQSVLSAAPFSTLSPISASTSTLVAAAVASSSQIFSEEKNAAFSLRQAIEQTWASSPVLKRAAAAVTAGQADVQGARSDFFPAVSLNATKSHTVKNIDNAAATTSNPQIAGIQLSQSLFSSGRTLSAVGEQTHALEALRQTVRLERLRMVTAVAEAYGAVLRDAEILTLRQGYVAALTAREKEAALSFKVGEGTRTDQEQAAARLATGQADLATAISEKERSFQAFKSLVGLAPQGLKWPALAGKGGASSAAFAQKVSLESLLEAKTSLTTQELMAAIESHPSVQAAQEQLEAARMAVRRAWGAFGPEVRATAGMTRNDGVVMAGSASSYDERTVGLSLSMSLFQGGRLKADLQRAKASQVQEEAALEEVRRAITADVSRAYAAWQAAQERLAALAQAKVSADITAKGVAMEVEVGDRPPVDILDARQEQLEAGVAYTQARAGVLTAAARLLQALGMEPF